MQGALGLIASRVNKMSIKLSITNQKLIAHLYSSSVNQEADFFIGDLTVTYERSQAVEFSFLTLVDSELFLTHSPGLLNEALALIRPFHWIVRNVLNFRKHFTTMLLF